MVTLAATMTTSDPAATSPSGHRAGAGRIADSSSGSSSATADSSPVTHGR